VKNPNKIDAHIGQRIRMRRNELGLSQEKLGDALGVSFQQVQKYEKGINRVGGSRMHQMSTALACTPVYFFEGLGRDTAPSADIVQEIVATKHGMRLFKAFASIADAGVQQRLVDLAESLAGKPAAVE
jgi:transcriptional regulator with XRE-family HTH domain